MTNVKYKDNEKDNGKETYTDDDNGTYKEKDREVFSVGEHVLRDSKVNEQISRFLFIVTHRLQQLRPLVF